MPNKITSFFAFCCFFAFWTFMVVHYAHMKTPFQTREVASWAHPVKPMYDASFKL